MTTGDELDDLARTYYLDPPADVWIEERVQAWILPWLATQCQGRTLEMGWGTGIVTAALLGAGLGERLTVVEGSSALVEAAASATAGWIGPEMVLALFEDFDPGPVFDTVLALHVLEHVERPVDLLRRIRSWLKPGGQVIIVVPNAWSIHRRVGALMSGDMVDTLSERDKLVGHVRVYGFGELFGNVREAGFVLDGAYPQFGWFLKPVPNSLMVGWAPELIDALCDLGWHGEPEDAANIGVIAIRA